MLAREKLFVFVVKVLFFLLLGKDKGSDFFFPFVKIG